MQAGFHTIATFCFILSLLFAKTSANSNDDSDIINPNWVKPGWKNHRHHGRQAENCPVVEECKCPAIPECHDESANKEPPIPPEDNQNAFVYYKKFVKRIFDERRLDSHPEEASYKLRNIQFKISKQQVLKLKEARTASEIDDVVTEIVEQSEESVYYAMAESLCWSLLSMYVKAVQSTVFLYWVLPAIVMIVILGVGRILSIRLWILIPLLAILITYVITYRDCNNRLELDSLTKLVKTGDGRNPCNKHAPTNWLDRLFYKDTEAECVEHLRTTYGMKRNFCDPSEVFIEMVAKLQLKYFESFVHQMVSIFKSSTASSGWIESFFICIFIVLLVYVLLTVGLKYGLYTSGRFFADVVTRPRVTQRAQESIRSSSAEIEPQQALPQLPFNININITKPRRSHSRIERITSRIEEVEENTIAKPKAIEASAVHVVEEGSGDGPKKFAQQPEDDSSSDDSSSTTEELSKEVIDAGENKGNTPLESEGKVRV